jgi:hypothetical protein
MKAKKVTLSGIHKSEMPPSEVIDSVARPRRPGIQSEASGVMLRPCTRS